MELESRENASTGVITVASGPTFKKNSMLCKQRFKEGASLLLVADETVSIEICKATFLFFKKKKCCKIYVYGKYVATHTQDCEPLRRDCLVENFKKKMAGFHATSFAPTSTDEAYSQN